MLGLIGGSYTSFEPSNLASNYIVYRDTNLLYVDSYTDTPQFSMAASFEVILPLVCCDGGSCTLSLRPEQDLKSSDHPSCCGDLVVEGNEECDGGGCCTDQCTLLT